MFKEDSKEQSGNNRFEGYAIDLIHALSESLGFKYEFILQKDGDYGTPIEGSDKWKGMLGAVMNGVRKESFLSSIKIIRFHLNFADSRSGNY